jgi:hypothetical protein
MGDGQVVQPAKPRRIYWSGRARTQDCRDIATKLRGLGRIEAADRQRDAAEPEGSPWFA